MSKLSVRSLPVKGKRVLLRSDLNCPLDATGAVLDDTRIRASLPTIEYLLDQGAARVVLMSHLGRPDGKRDPKLTLEPVRQRLQELLGRPVTLIDHLEGPEALERSLKGPEPVLLLENIRFYPYEENPQQNTQFVMELARLGDCYVNDAFGTAHRRHASTADLAACFPGAAAAGLLMEKELSALLPVLHSPPRPLVVVLGGGKVSSKVGVLKSLAQLADTLCLGGAMAQTFLAARGYEMGKASVETESFSLCHDIEREAGARGCRLVLPLDLVYEVPRGPSPQTRAVGEKIPSDWEPKDVGARTVAAFSEICGAAAGVLWNGPLGVIETPPFDAGTIAFAHALSQIKGVTIVGGGHTVAALEHADLQNSFSHVSTGGGATLELFELGTLPGVEALSDTN
jgi:phosphoglycerate kinase